MDQDANQMQATPTLCRSGCGFYGNSSFDGMCSKCYKDSIKKKQSPPNSGCLSSGSSSHSAIPSPTSLTGLPTVPILASTSASEQPPQPERDEAPQTAASCNSPDDDGKKRKNRCGICKKKVGLTGFGCRCGGLFCSVHRYSDKHHCSFDYRRLGADEIRKNNPVVVGEKISKI